jgi:hypothetical protein
VIADWKPQFHLPGAGAKVEIPPLSALPTGQISVVLPEKIESSRLEWVWISSERPRGKPDHRVVHHSCAKRVPGTLDAPLPITVI